jgi:Icc-related predicted phosphoesterase
MKILAVSDVVVDWIYSPKIRLLLSDIDLAIGCGDLTAYYMDYIISSLNVPMLQVYGNHSIPAEKGENNHYYQPGAINVHRRVIYRDGFTFAGVEGSIKYRNGPFQYSQSDMWLNAIILVPALLANHIKYGRYLNLLITHAPPWGIHDQPDLAHQGIKAFLWLINTFQPDYHIHGHIHVYRPDTVTETLCGKTRVINAFGYKQIELL